METHRRSTERHRAEPRRAPAQQAGAPVQAQAPGRAEADAPAQAAQASAHAMAQQLAQRLRALRLDRQLTQEQLAERADLHPGYVQKLEAGQRLPSLPVLVRLAGALDVGVTDLVAVLDGAPPAGGPTGADPLSAALRTCTPRQRALILDFVRLIQSHDV